MRKRGQIRLTALLVGALLCLAVMPALAQSGPAFQILLPLPDQQLTSQELPIAISFQSADDTPIVRLEAYIDSAFLIQGRITNPIVAGSVRLNATIPDKVKAGSHTLYLRLYDSLGRVSQLERSITFKPLESRRISEDRTPPRVRIVEPKDGDVITTRTNIRVEATDDTDIKWVTIYVNDKLLAMMNEKPYLLLWDPIKGRLTTGDYTIRANALDLMNNEGKSAPVRVTYRAPMAGRTPIEQDSGVTTKVEVPLGVCPVTNLPTPSGGQGIARWPFSNLMAPFSGMLAGVRPAMPDFRTASTSAFQLPAAPGDALIVLPPKLLPGQGEMAKVASLTSRGTALAPALAMRSDVASPVALGAGQPATTYRAPLLVPAEARPTAGAPATELVTLTVPVLIAMGPAPEKLSPRAQMTPAVTPDAPAVAGTAETVTPDIAAGTATVPVLDTPDKATPAASQDAAVQVPTIADARVDPLLPVHPVEAPAPVAPAFRIAAAPKLPAASVTSQPATETPAPMPVMQVDAPYTVKSGDTLIQIARANATTPEEITKLNPGISPTRLTAGTEILVPKSDARIYLDSTPLAGHPDPYIANGYSMVPFRVLAEAKDGVVVWLPQTREVNAWVNNTFIGVKIDQREAKINTETVQMPVAASIRDARTMVPLRFLMTAMKLQAEYNPETGTYNLVSQAAK